MSVETVMKKYEQQLMQLPNVAGVGYWEEGHILQGVFRDGERGSRYVRRKE
jgi:hypothetical protein